ncbi:MAG: ATP-dependent helicase [Chloroflexi bacterium]|nr:ATP-dependent helicase [Chloroflexota bacterium]
MTITVEMQDKILNSPPSLTGPQRDVVLSDARYLRIIAAAGAGKTETITRHIVYLLAGGCHSKSIVAFTFTELAAREMKERIYRRVEVILGVEASKQIGEMYIGTIHAFAARILQDKFGYGNYDVLDANQEVAFLMRHGWSLGLGPGAKLAVGKNYSENCQTFLKTAHVVYDELLDLAKLGVANSDFLTEFQKYEQLLDQNRLLTFGRMIRLAVEKLQANRDPLADYQHLIVDEYQDINRAQEQLITLVAASASCYVVGDPRQCIYQWRGSDPSCFDTFATRFGAQTIPLMENRRSVPAIVNVANNISANLEEPDLGLPMAPARAEPGSVLWTRHGDNSDEAVWIAKQIRSLVDCGICQYQDVAILLRSVSTSGPELIQALKAQKIPYLVGGRVGLFNRDEAQAVGRIFAWCADMWWQEDPYRWDSRIQDAPLLASAVGLWQPVKATKQMVESLRLFKDRTRNGQFHNLTEAYQALLITLGFLQLEPSNPEHAVVMANLGRFNTLLTDFESAKRRGGAKPNWEQDLKDLTWYMNTYANGAYEEQPADDLRGQSAVQLMTVHQAKGLQWPVVFLPALVNRRFPSGKAGQPQSWLIPDTLFDRARYEGGENEERKLFYVAVTRARDGLCLSSFNRIRNSVSPSSFLQETKLASQAHPAEPFILQIQPTGQNDEDIVTYSATKIIEYLRCAYFYRLRHLWGYQPGLAEWIGYGKSIHHVLRVVSEQAMAGQDPLRVLSSVIQDFHLPFADKGIIAIAKKNAESSLASYVRNYLADIKATQEVEARLEFQLSKQATVEGRVDVIIAPNGERELRDYKTANDPEDNQRTNEEAAFQLHLYALGLGEIGQPVARATIAHVTEKDKAKQVVPVPMNQQSLKRARNEAEIAVKGILSGVFPGKPAGFCEACDYRAICRFQP